MSHCRFLSSRDSEISQEDGFDAQGEGEVAGLVEGLGGRRARAGHAVAGEVAAEVQRDGPEPAVEHPFAELPHLVLRVVQPGDQEVGDFHVDAGPVHGQDVLQDGGEGGSAVAAVEGVVQGLDDLHLDFPPNFGFPGLPRIMINEP